MLEDRLRIAGYHFDLRDTEGHLVLDIDPNPRLRVPTLNILLFVATLISVYFVPVFLKNLALVEHVSEAFQRTLLDLRHGAGIEFTVAIISILFVHEMGHFVASRRRGIVTSWPYFIPAPNIIGTFGAIIKSRSPFWNRRDLIEVGAAGPIAGWVVAIAWLLWGLSRSSILPTTAFGPADLAFSLDGESLLVRALTPLLVGNVTPGYLYQFTEAAFAGWVGLLVTAINLLPIGQLDGGHILYGIGRRVQKPLGWVAIAVLAVLGLQSAMWWVFAAFGLIFGVAHPPTLDDSRELAPHARLLGIIAVIIFILSFTPVPFRN
jgi:membrane-associated protease RseP (regulator of RpoE activity)